VRLMSQEIRYIRFKVLKRATVFCLVGRDAVKSGTKIRIFCGNIFHTLKMAAAYSSGISVNLYQIKQLHISQKNLHCCVLNLGVSDTTDFLRLE